jgi:hypothetical protein
VDPSGPLTTVAQIAVGLAGFTGIVIAFTRRPGELTPIERYRFAILFGTSFGALFLSLVPFGVALVGVEAPALWRLSSAAFVAFEIGLVASLLPRTLRYVREARELFDLRILGGLAAGHALAIVLLIVNAFGGFAGAAPGVFLWALVWLLFHTALQFARMLFVRPLT